MKAVFVFSSGIQSISWDFWVCEFVLQMKFEQERIVNSFILSS